MVRNTLKTLKHLLLDFYSMSVHFDTLWIKSLGLAKKIKTLNFFQMHQKGLKWNWPNSIIEIKKWERYLVLVCCLYFYFLNLTNYPTSTLNLSILIVNVPFTTFLGLHFFTLDKKIKLSIKDFFSKCDQIRRKLRFGHIYWRNSEWKTSLFVRCN